MRIIPVIDLKHGMVVRGVGGRREKYRPINSPLAGSAAPLDIANAFRRCFGLGELYLADLDAIAGQPPLVSVYRELRQSGFALWVDAGIRGCGDVDLLFEAGVDVVVAGLETLRSWEELAAILDKGAAGRCCFSLDLNNGRPLGHESFGTDAFSVADRVIQCGVATVLVLDLADVGGGEGPSTLPLCSKIHERYPKIRLVAGGGVRDDSDLLRMEEAGVSIALVASALHDARIRLSPATPSPKLGCRTSTT